jgi:hypothetical protein
MRVCVILSAAPFWYWYSLFFAVLVAAVISLDP